MCVCEHDYAESMRFVRVCIVYDSLILINHFYSTNFNKLVLIN